MLKKENLIKMAKVRSEWCVSIYLPINQADSNQNRNCFKNQMFQAEKQLLELGMLPLKVARMLMPIELLLDDTGFWKNRCDGFAAFLTPDSFVWFSIYCQIKELVIVTDRFHLKPLLTNNLSNNSFYLLTLSRQHIKFYETSGTELNEIFLRGMPRSLEHFLLSVELETGTQMISVSRGGLNYPCNSSFETNKRIKIEEVFRRVNKVIAEFLKNEERPLILAGLEYLHTIYHSVNSYQNIVKDGIIGNIGNLSKKQLLGKALPIIKFVCQTEYKNATIIYQQRKGTELASDNFWEIFKASQEGRIETLFVPINKQIWGLWDENSDDLQIHQDQQPGNKDLFCLTSINTLLKDGKVLAVLSEEMPNNSEIAAILRERKQF